MNEGKISERGLEGGREVKTCLGQDFDQAQAAPTPGKAGSTRTAGSPGRSRAPRRRPCPGPR